MGRPLWPTPGSGGGTNVGKTGPELASPVLLPLLPPLEIFTPMPLEGVTEPPGAMLPMAPGPIGPAPPPPFPEPVEPIGTMGITGPAAPMDPCGGPIGPMGGCIGAMPLPPGGPGARVKGKEHMLGKLQEQSGNRESLR